MRFILLCLTLLSLPALAQKRPELNDGEMHGDAPYLLEAGWKALLSGKDLSGWKGQGDGRNEWMTTTGILWDRLLGPTRLRAVPGPTPGGTDRKSTRLNSSHPVSSRMPSSA